MKKILTITLFLSLILTGCATNKGNQDVIVKKNSEFVNTTDTEFSIELPSNITKVANFNKKKYNLGEKNNIFFEFISAEGGNYWVSATPIESVLHKDAEVILNINADQPESISLARDEGNSFHGIGMDRKGLINIDLILKIPKQKTIIFNFDISLGE